MTNTDKALLLAEWNGGHGDFGVDLCPVCKDSGVHELGCVMDLALDERGFATQEDRNRARAAIDAISDTLPPPGDSG